MIAFIGSIIKYSIITITVLILSHVIQIGGTTISDYVKNTLDWASLYSPSTPGKPGKPGKGFMESLSDTMNGRLKEIDQIDSEVTPQDQKALNQVIEKSQHKR